LPCDRCRDNQLPCQITRGRAKRAHPYQPGTPGGSSPHVARRLRRGPTSETDVRQEDLPSANEDPPQVHQHVPSGQPPHAIQEGPIPAQQALSSQDRSGNPSQVERGTSDAARDIAGNQDRNVPLTESQEAAITLTDMCHKVEYPAMFE